MATATRTFSKTGEDLGERSVLNRNGDDVRYCLGKSAGGGGRAGNCAIVDDAVLYLRKITEKDRADLVRKMESSIPGIELAPPGRLHPFYRVVAASHYISKAAQRVPTLKELYFILDTMELEQTGRADDILRVRTLVDAMLGQTTQFTPSQKAYVERRQKYLDSTKGPITVADYEGTGTGGGDDKPKDKGKANTGVVVGAVAALALLAKALL